MRELNLGAKKKKENRPEREKVSANWKQTGGKKTHSAQEKQGEEGNQSKGLVEEGKKFNDLGRYK